MRSALLGVWLVCALAAACEKKPTVSEDDFLAAIDVATKLEQSFTTDYERAETELQKLRETDPAAAAKLIETKILPMFPPITAAIGKSYELGKQLIDSEIREDGLRAKAAKLLEQLDLQRRGFERIREAYADQAKKLAKGKLSEPDVDALVKSLEEGIKMIGAE